MPTLTIRNVPEDIVERLKVVAQNKGHSMEQEVRNLLTSRYASRQSALDRMKARWNPETAPTSEEIDEWIESGRP